MKKTCFFLLLTLPLFANNLQVHTSSIASVDMTNDYALVQFDLSWDNSFRDDVNWDAAWVFIKYQPTGGEWQHATLNTQAGNHTFPSGYTGSVGVTGSTGMGVFIYRDSNGSGNTSLSEVQLRWEYGSDGLADNSSFSAKVFAIEMVYVPDGSFYVGDRTSGFRFYDGDNSSQTFLVDGSQITFGQNDGNLWWDGGDHYVPDEGQTLQSNFPTGYNAFYCMKYEISQDLYAEFLNTLTATQDGNRFPDEYDNFRHTIGGSAGNRSADIVDRACNYLNWMDGAAFADWAGLRPITEMEFEKACRGPVGPVAWEYAWGNTSIATTAYSLSNDGTPNASVTNSASDPNGNASYSTTDGSIDGPLRCGIFATNASSRAEAGAGYYGIMELSGNLTEQTVCLASSIGLNYTGTHGDGILSNNGYATNSDWPGYNSGEVKSASGSTGRGGDWYNSSSLARVSARISLAQGASSRQRYNGFRCVRSAD